MPHASPICFTVFYDKISADFSNSSVSVPLLALHIDFTSLENGTISIISLAAILGISEVLKYLLKKLSIFSIVLLL